VRLFGVLPHRAISRLWLGLLCAEFGEERPFRLPVSARRFWCLVIDGGAAPAQLLNARRIGVYSRPRPAAGAKQHQTQFDPPPGFGSILRFPRRPAAAYATQTCCRLANPCDRGDHWRGTVRSACKVRDRRRQCRVSCRKTLGVDSSTTQLRPSNRFKDSLTQARGTFASLDRERCLRVADQLCTQVSADV
jgi:hypothetical protein